MLGVIAALALAQSQSLQMADEGAPIGSMRRINCVGSGVVCSASGTTGTITVGAGVGGGAPAEAQYWTGAADGTLSAEKNLGALGTGLVVNTAGVPSKYTGSACGASAWATETSATGALTCVQPDFGNISGVVTDAQVPNTITVDLATRATSLVNMPACNDGQALSSDGGSLFCQDLIVFPLPAPKSVLARAVPNRTPSLIPGIRRPPCNRVRRFNCSP